MTEEKIIQIMPTNIDGWVDFRSIGMPGRGAGVVALGLTDKGNVVKLYEGIYGEVATIEEVLDNVEMAIADDSATE